MKLIKNTILAVAAGILLQNNVCLGQKYTELQLEQAIENGQYSNVKTIIAAQPQLLSKKFKNGMTPLVKAQNLWQQKGMNQADIATRNIKNYLQASENPKNALSLAIKEKPANVDLAQEALNLVGASWVAKDNALDQAALQLALNTASTIKNGNLTLNTPDKGLDTIVSLIQAKMKK